MNSTVDPPIVDELAAVLERLLSFTVRLEMPGHLSLSTAATLTTLSRSDGMRLTDLTAAESVTQPAMTQLVTRLERDGLAERSGDPDDGRAVIVRITDAGRQLIAARKASRASQVAALFGQLETTDRASISAALPALERLVELATQQTQSKQQNQKLTADTTEEQ